MPLHEFLLRFFINILATVLVVRFVYYPRHRNKDYVFTFFLFNTIIFLLASLLFSIEMDFAFTFGLFAVFAILRYRTVTVPIREMGYFFLCVTLALINAVAPDTDGFFYLIFANFIALGVTIVLDRQLSLQHENFKEIIYEKIELIRPENRDEMLRDLRERTGLPIHRIEIIRIDFLRDVARIHAFYLSGENENTNRGLGPDEGD